MKGLCADCQKTVELTQHGACIECGSNSIAHPKQYSRVLNTHQAGVINPDLIVEEMNKLVESIGDELTQVQVASHLLFYIRVSRSAGLSLGQTLENFLSLWHIAVNYEEAESDPSSTN